MKGPKAVHGNRESHCNVESCAGAAGRRNKAFSFTRSAGLIAKTVALLSPLYLRLIRKFAVRPICSEEEIDHAIAVVDSLLIRMDELAPEEPVYLAILSNIVEKYESEVED
jgi:hypothetical protein